MIGRISRHLALFTDHLRRLAAQKATFGDRFGRSESRHSLRCNNAPQLTSMVRYGPFELVVLLGLGGLAVVLVRTLRRLRSAKSRNIWDYVLLWPLIFDQPARRERVAAGGRFFTARELVGIIIFVVVLVIGLTFF
jgi:hypothetical protein